MAYRAEDRETELVKHSTYAIATPAILTDVTESG